VSFNCEHFTRWCATGRLDSDQVKTDAVTAGTLAVMTTAALVAKTIKDRKESGDERT
jgi:hypothetical protein